MANLRRWILSILLVAGLLGMTGPVQAQETRPQKTVPPNYEQVGENAAFQLFVDRETLAFNVVDKRSGYVWQSNLPEVTKEDKLNKTWTAFARSGISIDYLDQKAIPIRASITNSNHSIQFAPIEQGFDATVVFSDPGITLRVVVKLEDAGVSVEVPFDSIKQENPAFKLGTLSVYPFFGAVREADLPGYMFLPDGSGTLVRFQAKTKAKNMLYGRYYGSDLGMLATMPFDVHTRPSYKMSIPVIGMAHQEKQSAYIQVVEKGASYAEFQAHPAGIITRFNFLFNLFIYNESYFQATNRSGAGITTLQPATNTFDVKIHYRFLSGNDADYVGMARSYQQYLVEQGQLSRIAGPDGKMGIRLEFLGGEKEKVVFWNRLIPMTTVTQMQTILSQLKVDHPQVVYFGWQPMGASSMPPDSVRIDPALGNTAQLRSLEEALAAQGGRLYLYIDPQAAFLDQGGYSPRYDLAMSITNVNLMGYNRNMVNYYLNLPALSRRYTRLSEQMVQQINGGLAVDGLGSMLYSDFKENRILNREQTVQEYRALVQQSPAPAAFYQPNDYLFSRIQAYFDMPLSDSGYVYASESVPFLQITLAGYVPFYGPAMNFSSNLEEDFLRHADYGVYPSFFLTQESTAKILLTPSSWIFTSSISQWGQQIQDTYRRLNEVLGPVAGQRMLAREKLAEGVFATTYENGRQVIVNYTNEAFTAGTTQVGPRSAVNREVQP